MRRLAPILLPLLSIALAACSSLPSKRVDTVLEGARRSDLGSPLAEVSISIGASDPELERVVREVFPVAVSKLGILSDEGGRAEYSIWLRQEDYSIGIDEYSAVLLVLKLRAKVDGTPLATTIVADESRLEAKSPGYIYGLLRRSLGSLTRSVAMEKDSN